ncbi:hypothetical protein [Cytobacillus pseudoceanisediminis]|uniref:hypothetical protein n=1 Tax=Cytobacillus pseudoceanisediminis TaxID=3051614 RepID=UPI003C2D96FF
MTDLYLLSLPIQSLASRHLTFLAEIQVTSPLWSLGVQSEVSAQYKVPSFSIRVAS